jgi:hypothetical protein
MDVDKRGTMPMEKQSATNGVLIEEPILNPVEALIASKITENGEIGLQELEDSLDR